MDFGTVVLSILFVAGVITAVMACNGCSGSISTGMSLGGAIYNPNSTTAPAIVQAVQDRTVIAGRSYNRLPMIGGKK